MGTAGMMGLWDVMKKIGGFGEPQTQGVTDYVKGPPMEYATSHCLVRTFAARRIGEDHQNVINVRVECLATINVNVLKVELFSLHS